MPSFAFWKSSKADAKVDETINAAGTNHEDEMQHPLLTKPIPSPNLDLDTGNQDSGKFTFEDMEQLATTPLQKFKDFVRPSAALSSSIGQVDADAALLDDEHIQSRCSSDEAEQETASTVHIRNHSNQVRQINLPPTRPAPSPTRVPEDEVHALSCDEKVLPPPTPARVAPQPQETSQKESAAGLNSPPTRPAPHTPPPSRVAPLPPRSDVSRPSSTFSTRSISTTHSPSPSQSTDITTKRLHRPTELNLGSVTNGRSRAPSELEKQSSLMRSSTTQSKAALLSPTALLNQRLNGSSTSKNRESKVHVFVPPSPPRDGCLLPGPAGQAVAFTSTSVPAKTEKGRPAWWCKWDKLVVFDGMETGADGATQPLTRTSKGLSIARRRGDTETVVIPLNCAHCQEMLNRHDWKYDMQVCKRSVCSDCKERCKWESEQERVKTSPETEGNRYRADSVLQDDQV